MMGKRMKFDWCAGTWLCLPTLLGMLAACAEGPPAHEVTRDTVAQPAVANRDLFLASAMAALPPAGLTLADLPSPDSRGAQLVLQYCTACHALPSPRAHSATDWPRVVRRMWLRIERVGPRFDVQVPSTAERVVILPYLVENGLEVTTAELPAAPGRELFRKTCSQCHALPDPGQHSPVEWATVVRRMTQHRQDMLRITTNRSDLEQITRYLERASSAASP